jgi:SAM-dependent methyltransferase
MSVVHALKNLIFPSRHASGFRHIVETLPLRNGCQVLDVGAGGFCGDTTTIYLRDILKARIDAVEIDPALAEKLSERFGETINVVCSDIESFLTNTDNHYDLIVHDIAIMDIFFDEMLPSYSRRLNKGGYIVAAFIFDHAKTNQGPAPLFSPEASAHQANFLLRRFGSLAPTRRQIQARLRPGCKVEAIVDKFNWRIPQLAGLGWLVLKV